MPAERVLLPRPSSPIRAASLISGCYTPISPPPARTGGSTTPYLLYLDGVDLRRVRLVERKRLLAELLADASERLLYTEHLEGNGAEIYARACAMGLEGIISKQQDAPYRSGRTMAWSAGQG